MDPILATILTERLDHRPPSKAVQQWLNSQEQPLLALEQLQAQAGLPIPPRLDSMELYFERFYDMYLPLDRRPAQFNRLQLFWTLNLLAMLQDSFRFRSYLFIYRPDETVIKQSFLWLAERGLPSAMKFLLPHVVDSQGKLPQKMLWQLAEIGTITSNFDLYRSSIASISFEKTPFYDWKWDSRQFLHSLSTRSDYCRQLLLEVIQRQPLLLDELIKIIFEEIPALTDWQLELLLELSEAAKIKVSLVYFFRLGTLEQTQRLLQSSVATDPAYGFEPSAMLTRQIYAGVTLEVVRPFFGYSLEPSLGKLFRAALSPQADLEIVGLLLDTYSGLTLNPVLQRLRLEDDVLSSTVLVYVERSQALFQELLPLMRKLALKLQADGTVTLTTRLILETLTPQQAFNILSYLTSMESSQDQTYQNWNDCTGMDVLEALQSANLSLVLLGLGYNDPIVDQVDLVPLAVVCAAYHQSPDIALKIINRLDDVDLRDPALHAACLYNKPHIVEWILSRHGQEGDSYRALEWANDLEKITSRDEVVAVLRRYPW